MKILEDILAPAFIAAGWSNGQVQVTPSDRPELSDFQSNSAFQAARSLSKSPLEIAQQIVDTVVDPRIQLSVAGKGFINIKLSDEFLVQLLLCSDRPEPKNQLIMMDFGGPNMAKAMHVGHLRSLVIGDSLSRILRWQGYDVLTDIHWGDWGYQMGLILAGIWSVEFNYIDFDSITIESLQRLYPEAAQLAKSDPGFKGDVHNIVYSFQHWANGFDKLWHQVIALSEQDIKLDLDTLGIEFNLYNGESDTLTALQSLGEEFLTKSEGASILELDDLPPLIWKNSYDSYLYGATDVATIWDRHNNRPSKIIYVVDQRQELHFKQVFAAAHKIIDNLDTQLIHAGFGTVNGPDNKPLKTRDGGTPKLRDMLNEAIQAASEKNSDPEIAQAVAIAGVKFADLSNKRQTSYVHDVNKMVSHEGRTGPYLLYQVVRIKHALSKATVPAGPIVPESVIERQLVLKLIAFQFVINRVEVDLSPHHLAEYLYGLAQMFSVFYSDHRIADHASRISLVELLLETLTIGLDLLGIQTVETM